MRSDIMKTVGKLLAIVLSMLVLHACEGAIYDTNEDCTVNYRVKFKYDYNMKFADAFAHEVEAVTLYLIDEEGNVAWQKTERGDILAVPGYAMDVDVAPGTYDLLVWAGTTDKGSFDIPETLIAQELTCTLKRERAADGSAYVDKDLDRLFHGYLADQTFSPKYGTYEYTVPLVKNTNVVRVVLQQLSGEPVPADKFQFTITDDNGVMAWDNTVLSDEPITYNAWSVEMGEAEIDYNRSVFSATVAELTVARLMADHHPRLTVTNKEKNEVVFSIPLKDYCLLVKGQHNKTMSDQEYLDRQDEYNMTFFLDEGYRWLDAFIYINSWKVILQNNDL